MPLLREDLERLEGLGLKREDFAVERDGFLRLRNTGGYCVFYDIGSGRCKVYGARPLGCRLYPLVFDEERGALLDPECPLAGFFSEECSEAEGGSSPPRGGFSRACAPSTGTVTARSCWRSPRGSYSPGASSAQRPNLEARGPCTAAWSC
uniref:YkgJ family cysteine cluster protein n=1 Tax=Thermofilum pendens TaxID=2269 RepID=A0A7C3WJT7_THEPE